MISPDTKLKKNEDGVWTRDTTEDELRELLGDDPPIILERNTMGLLVQISYVKDKDLLLLECQNGKHYGIAAIEPENVYEALNHPLDGRFIANPGDLFPKSKSL